MVRGTDGCTTDILIIHRFLYHRAIPPPGDLLPSIGAAATLLTVSTNVVVTSLITFRLLRARRALAKVLPAESLQVYTGVIAILVESAAPLTLFGIVAAILQQLSAVLSVESLVSSSVFDALFYSFCASSSIYLPYPLCVLTPRSYDTVAFAAYDHLQSDDRTLVYEVPDTQQGGGPCQPYPVRSQYR